MAKALTSIALVALLALPVAAADAGFVPLFDGKDLTAWQPTPGSWVIENTVLFLKDRTDGQMQNKYYLWTAKTYGDFVLELEFKVAARTNSGVFIRTADVTNPVQTGIEIQVSSEAPGQPLSRGSVAGIYDLAAPKKNMLKPEDWNRMVITCQGSKVSVALNGETVSEADLDRWVEARKNPDGSLNKFRRPLKDFARQGYIGLQDHGSPVWFRNIRINALEGK